MRKPLFLALVLVMCLSLSACSSEKEDSSIEGPTAPETGSFTVTGPADHSTEKDTDNSAEDLTITDASGNSFILSTPTLYTFSRAEAETLDIASMEIFIEGAPYDEGTFGPAPDYLNEFFWSKMNTVYALPEGAVVTLPGNILTQTIFELDITFENGGCYATEFNTINYPGFTFITLNGTGYILGVELQYADTGTDETANDDEMGASGTAIGDNEAGTIFFYVPEDITAPNPFAS